MLQRIDGDVAAMQFEAIYDHMGVRGIGDCSPLEVIYDHKVISKMQFDDLDSALESAQEGGSDDNSSSSGGDYERYPRVKLTPTAAIGGEIIDVSFTGDLEDEQNIRGEGFGGDFIFTIKNPELVRGTLYEAAGRTSAESNLIEDVDASYYPFDVDRYHDKPTRDFRIVDGGDTESDNVSEMVKEVDGEYGKVGIEIYGSEFPSERREGFDDALDQYDTVDVFVGKQAGRIMMQSVDISQGRSAYVTDDGEKSNGLIEFPPNYGNSDWDPDAGDSYPRCAAVPMLHSELEGEEIILFKHFGDLSEAMEDGDDEGEDESTSRFRKHYGDVLHVGGDGYTVLTDSANDDFLEPELDRREGDFQRLEFHEPEGGWGNSGDDDGDEFNFDELDDSDDSEETADDDGIEFDDLDKDTRDFVTQAAGYLETNDTEDVDEAFDDYTNMVMQAIDDDEIADHNPSDLRTMIESRAA